MAMDTEAHKDITADLKEVRKQLTKGIQDSIKGGWGAPGIEAASRMAEALEKIVQLEIQMHG